MTEEDTFRRLQKPNIREMISFWDRRIDGVSVDSTLSPEYSHEREVFFNSYNWTWNSFFAARIAYYNL